MLFNATTPHRPHGSSMMTLFSRSAHLAILIVCSCAVACGGNNAAKTTAQEDMRQEVPPDMPDDLGAPDMPDDPP